MAKKEKDSRIFWGIKENPKKRMMLRITWFSQQTSKQMNVTNMNKQTNTTVRWESLDIFWVSIERGNSWVGDVFPNLGNNFARHPDHFSSQLVSSRPKKHFADKLRKSRVDPAVGVHHVRRHSISNNAVNWVAWVQKNYVFHKLDFPLLSNTNIRIENKI